MDERVAKSERSLRQRRGEDAGCAGSGLPFGVENIGAANNGGMFRDRAIDNRGCGTAGVGRRNPFAVDAGANSDCVAGLRKLCGCIDCAKRVIGGPIATIGGVEAGLSHEPFPRLRGCTE